MITLQAPKEWDEASQTAIGGFMCYAIPVAWTVFCIYCFSSFLGLDEFTSSTTVQPYPNTPQPDFFLPKLTCIAPKGCYISPVRVSLPWCSSIVVDRRVSQDVKSACNARSRSVAENLPGKSSDGQETTGATTPDPSDVGLRLECINTKA